MMNCPRQQIIRKPNNNANLFGLSIYANVEHLRDNNAKNPIDIYFT